MITTHDDTEVAMPRITSRQSANFFESPSGHLERTTRATLIRDALNPESPTRRLSASLLRRQCRLLYWQAGERVIIPRAEAQP